MTQLFVNRTELLPAGETSEDHKKWSQEEADLVDLDRITHTSHAGGLFRGCFRYFARRTRPVIRDQEDGVDRCPVCAWELEDGICGSCGYGTDSGSVGSPSVSDGPIDDAFEEEPRGSRRRGYLYDGTDRDDYDSERSIDGDRSLLDALGRSTQTLEDDVDDGDYAPALRLDRTHQRTRPGIPPLRNRHHTWRPASERYSYDPEIDMDSASDEDAGSLEDFVVNDEGEGPLSDQTSPRSIHYDTDEATDMFENSQSYGGGGYHPRFSDTDFASSTRGISSRDLGDVESSVDGTTNTHRRRGRRVISTSPYLSDEGSAVPEQIEYSGRTAMHNASQALTDGWSPLQHSDTDESIRNRRFSGGRSRDIPIEVGSDSGSPAPLQRSWRRRRRVYVSSDDEDMQIIRKKIPQNLSPESSSGSATLGRRSPPPDRAESEGTKPAHRRINPSSPILIGSSPVRSQSSNSTKSPPGGSRSSSHNTRYSFTPTPPRTNQNRRNAHSRSSILERSMSDALSTRAFPPRSRVPQNRSIQSPSPRRRPRLSSPSREIILPQSHQAGSSSRLQLRASPEMRERGQAKAMQKVARRQAKEAWRRRNRDEMPDVSRDPY